MRATARVAPYGVSRTCRGAPVGDGLVPSRVWRTDDAGDHKGRPYGVSRSCRGTPVGDGLVPSRGWRTDDAGDHEGRPY